MQKHNIFGNKLITVKKTLLLIYIIIHAVVQFRFNFYYEKTFFYHKSYKGSCNLKKAKIIILERLDN